MKSSQKKYGLLGWPVNHSLSPLMHNSAFSVFEIKGQYSLFPVRPDEFSNFMRNLEFKNISGLNITVPYKEKVLPYLNNKSDNLEKIGAANTIIVKDAGIKGFNTDFLGFSKHLQEIINPSGSKVALLGAGGAARAVVYSLVKDKVKNISIFDIDLNKSGDLIKIAKKWVSELGRSTVIEQVKSIKQLNILDKDLLINATPVGLKKDDPLIVDKNFFHKNLVVYDLIYNPALTKLLATAKEKGLRFSNGLKMLVYQGAQSFLYFTGADYNIDDVAKVMEKALCGEGD